MKKLIFTFLILAYGLLSAENTKQLTILFTNDEHGMAWSFDENEKKGLGGVAARKTLVDRIKQDVMLSEGGMLLVSSGDITMGDPRSNICENKPLINKITTSLEFIYNLDYSRSDSCIAIVENELGTDHSVVNILKAFQIFWRARPLAEGTDDYNEYVKYLSNTLEHAKILMDNPETRDEAIFYSLASSGI